MVLKALIVLVIFFFLLLIAPGDIAFFLFVGTLTIFVFIVVFRSLR